jgi:hypothetical protein
MPTFLHLLKADSGAMARPAIETTSALADARVIVVLLDDSAAPPLPPAVTVRRLRSGDLDYSGLLDLILESDHVIHW